MMTALFVTIGIILILGFVMFIQAKIMKENKKKIEEKESLIESMRYNNQELRKELQRLQIIDEEKEVKVEEINNTANSGIADILNDQLSNPSGED